MTSPLDYHVYLFLVVINEIKTVQFLRKVSLITEKLINVLSVVIRIFSRRIMGNLYISVSRKMNKSI